MPDNFFDKIIETYGREKPIRKDSELAKRNSKYTEILAKAVDINDATKKENKFYKKLFFYAIMGMLVVLVLWILIISILFVVKDYGFSEIHLVIAPLVSLITAIIILPRIIAEYLFPKEENIQYIEIIKAIIQKDKEK